MPPGQGGMSILLLMITTHTIIQGDAVEQMRNLPAGSVNVIVTSPPYNLGINYAGVSDNMPRQHYMEQFTPAWLTAAREVLHDEGHLFLNLGAPPSKPLLPMEVVLKAMGVGWVLQNTIHWVKSISFLDKHGEIVTRGHFKPINSPRYLNDTHEYIFHLTKDGCRPVHRKAEGVGVPYSDPSNIQRWKHTQGDNLRCAGTNWLIPYATINSIKLQRPHPATFPVELAERCIRLAGCPRVVLDPFVGIGSTMAAAALCEVEQSIGIDLSFEYTGECAARFGVPVSYA